MAINLEILSQLQSTTEELGEETNDLLVSLIEVQAKQKTHLKRIEFWARAVVVVQVLGFIAVLVR